MKHVKIIAVMVMALGVVISINALGEVTNQPPKPATPRGPSVGHVEVSYTFTSSAADPDGKDVKVRFDWGDASTSDWSDWMANGSLLSVKHSYSKPDIYSIRAQARDRRGVMSNWSEPYQCTISNEGTVKWKLKDIVKQGLGRNLSNATIDVDGHIYVTAVNYGHQYVNKYGTTVRAVVKKVSRLYAVSPEGKIKLKFDVPKISGGYPPVVDSKRTIYISSEDGLYAIEPNGKVKWSFKTEENVHSVAMGSNGTIYAEAGDKLYSIAPDGTKRWEFSGVSDPTVGLGGMIYVFGEGSIHALTSEGLEKWKCQVGEMKFSPVIGLDGVIYVVEDSYDYSDFDILWAINPNNGEVKWKYSKKYYHLTTSPVIGPDGTIYIAAGRLGGGVGTEYWKYTYLLAISSDRQVKSWSVPEALCSSPAINSNGTIYACSNENLYAIDLEGTVKWKSKIEDGNSPLIGPDGTIYVSTKNAKLYAVYGSGSLANTPWPRYRGNNQNEGRVSAEEEKRYKEKIKMLLNKGREAEERQDKKLFFKNYKEAYEYYKEATELGSEEASHRLKAILKKQPKLRK